MLIYPRVDGASGSFCCTNYVDIDMALVRRGVPPRFEDSTSCLENAGGAKADVSRAAGRFVKQTAGEANDRVRSVIDKAVGCPPQTK